MREESIYISVVVEVRVCVTYKYMQLNIHLLGHRHLDWENVSNCMVTFGLEHGWTRSTITCYYHELRSIRYTLLQSLKVDVRNISTVSLRISIQGL